MSQSPRAKDVMSPEVLTVRSDMTVRDLADFLIDHGISGAPVEDEKGKVVGVVSMTDIAMAGSDESIVEGGEPPADFYLGDWQESYDAEDLRGLSIRHEGRHVESIMTPSVISVPEDAPISEVAKTMLGGRVHRVLVTRDEEIVGIISSLDLLQILAEGE